jgi:alpha-L-rhamnosidase
VPANCSATVWFPEEDGANITENSGLAKMTGNQEGYQLFEVPAGNYTFSN